MKKLFARFFLKNILIFSPIFFLGGCLELFTTVTPLTGINVYDAYQISKDERGIYSITKDKFIKTKSQPKILPPSGVSTITLHV